jgi:hypothetical protein
LLYAVGLTAIDIAHLFDVHPKIIYADLHVFSQELCDTTLNRFNNRSTPCGDLTKR